VSAKTVERMLGHIELQPEDGDLACLTTLGCGS
jgi:hypothetical protein